MANKRVIDLPDLSQEVQEGQYVLVDSAGGTGKMDLKHIVDEAGNFDPAGEYPELFAGNLTTDKAQEDKIPYLFRKTGGNLSRVGERCYDTIIGASVGENQLVQSGATSVAVQTGHKYYAKIDGTESIGASTGSAITINDSAKDMVIDLSLYLPTNIADYIYSLESATAGSGIAKLREWGFLRGYQAYNSGSLESVEVTGKKVVGFNQWNEEWENGRYNINTGDKTTSTTSLRCKNHIKVVPNTQYYVNAPVVAFFVGFDASGNCIGLLLNDYGQSATKDKTLTTPTNCYEIVFYCDSYATYNHDICINLSSGRNGEYEPYTEQTYDYGDDVLNGIFKLDANNNLYADGDVKTSDGTITRHYGTRAYQSGDESLPDAITDGTTTVYKLTTPTTEQGDPFPSPQVCYPDGTEEYVTSNGVPVGHSTEYPYDLKGLVEGLIDVPDVPSTNGTYVLKATRSASGVAYNWVTG